jgi:hypothetical protein
MLTDAALIATAALLGGMALFSFVVAPQVFIRLPADQAGHLIQALFPWYYGFGGALAALAMLLALLGAPIVPMLLLVVILVGFLVAGLVLMPAINDARDRGLMGDDAAQRRFDRLHRASVVLNALQMLAVLAVLPLLATS